MFISSKIEIQKSDEDMCIVLDNLEEKFKQKLQYAARIDLHFPVQFFNGQIFKGQSFIRVRVYNIPLDFKI